MSYFSGLSKWEVKSGNTECSDTFSLLSPILGLKVGALADFPPDGSECPTSILALSF